MSSLSSTPNPAFADSDASPNTPLPQRVKPRRVLACVLCQQRKIKCDRNFPCAHCVKSRVDCIPAAVTQRRRRRRLPERVLLERLRKYEAVLAEHHISFEPLHPPSHDNESGDDSGGELPARTETATPLAGVPAERGPYEVKSMWHAMSRGYRDPDHESDSSYDDVRETAIKTAWDQSADKNDPLLFGSHRVTHDLATLHPEPVQMFRLWQTYLDNVNPLLKVTHTPSLQGRVIEAAAKVGSISPTLEALLFSIYSMAILSLPREDCQTMFGVPKDELLVRYQSGCQQALWNCGFLRSSDRDCLTALFLYLVSVRPSCVPQSLSSMLGVAIRVAQRMGLHSEAALAKCTVLEAEMRRRLWWAIVMFDSRITETANSKAATLEPSWDCRLPLSVNDADLRPEMKGPPPVQGKMTEAIFVVVRSEVGEYMRHTTLHLEFTNPALKPLAKHVRGDDSEDGELGRLEQMVEEQYLKHCDQDNAVHFMTVWSTRAYLAKGCLLEHSAKLSTSSARRTEAQRDAATALALRMLECDTAVMTSPLTRGFQWMSQMYFPFPAYIQLVQDLRRRPGHAQCAYAWQVINDNYLAWFNSQFKDYGPVYHLFSKLILQAWEAYEAASKDRDGGGAPPRIVTSIRETLAQLARQKPKSDAVDPSMDMNLDFDALPVSTPLGFASMNFPYNMGLQDVHALGRAGTAPADMLGPGAIPVDLNQVDWMSLGPWPGWGGQQ